MLLSEHTIHLKYGNENVQICAQNVHTKRKQNKKIKFSLINEPPQRLSMLLPSSYRNRAIHGNSNKSVLFPFDSFCSKISPQLFTGNRYKFGCAEASSGRPSRLSIDGPGPFVACDVGTVGGRVFPVGAVGVAVVKISSRQQTFGVF